MIQLAFKELLKGREVRTQEMLRARVSCNMLQTKGTSNPCGCCWRQVQRLMRQAHNCLERLRCTRQQRWAPWGSAFSGSKWCTEDVLDAIRRPPLGLAVSSGHVGIARFLVEEGANKDKIFNKRHGTTALHFVAEDGNLAMSASSLRSVATKMRPTILEGPLEEHCCIEHLKQTVWTLSAFLWSRVPVVTQPTKMHPTTAMPKWFAFCLSSRQNPSRKVPRSAVTVLHSPTSWRWQTWIKTEVCSLKQ